MESAALEHLKIDGYCCDHSSAFIFDWIFFMIAGKKGNYKSLDGFEIWPFQTGSTTIRRKTLRRIRHLVELDNWSNVTFGRNGQLVESYFSSKCV